jgi:hypothetical protein
MSPQTDSIWRLRLPVTMKWQPYAIWGNTMRVDDRYWLDYDSVAFAVLMVALGIVEILVLGI